MKDGYICNFKDRLMRTLPRLSPLWGRSSNPASVIMRISIIIKIYKLFIIITWIVAMLLWTWSCLLVGRSECWCLVIKMITLTIILMMPMMMMTMAMTIIPFPHWCTPWLPHHPQGHNPLEAS